MSPERGGRPGLPPRSSIPNNKNSEVAAAAWAALKRLNSLIKESVNWRDERSELESKVMRLSSALGKTSPDETREDPVTIRQRDKILRLESARDRLEDEVRRLRISLAESDRAITCSGARRLKERLRRTRDEEAERRLELGEQIIRLKAALGDAKSGSSCAGLNRLRKKLSEILKTDSKMDRVIADAANNGANVVSDLIDEVERVRSSLGREEEEKRRMKSALDHAEGDKTRLVKRVEELLGELDERRKEIYAKDIRLTQTTNELIGAKIAFKVKAVEVDGLRGLEDVEEERDDLRQRLQAASVEVQRLRDDLGEEKSRRIDLEIERDGLAEDLERMGRIVSERNEQIVGILADNEGLKLRCDKLEDDLLKVESNVSRACSGGDSGPRENELREINDGLKAQVNFLQGLKIELENELVSFKGRIEALRSDLESEKSERIDVAAENELLKSEAKRLVTGFVDQLEKLKNDKNGLEDRLRELQAKNQQLVSTAEELRTLKDAEELRMRNRTSRSTETAQDDHLETELNKAKDEARKALRDLSFLNSENSELKKEIEELERAKETDDGADRELQYHIHLQSLAIKRVLDFIRYVNDEDGVKPAMATFLEPTMTNAKIFRMDDSAATTFRMSQKLSERIFEAEVDVQRLEKVRDERNLLRKRMEVLIRDRIPQDFDPLISGSEILTEEEDDGDEKIAEMNRRITALQDQIKSKQSEAGRRLIEMRETMRRERIRLMEIAEGGNVAD